MRRDTKMLSRRVRVLAIVLAVVLLAYSVRMADIQLVHDDYYLAQATDINTRTTAVLRQAPETEKEESESRCKDHSDGADQ